MRRTHRQSQRDRHELGSSRSVGAQAGPVTIITDRSDAADQLPEAGAGARDRPGGVVIGREDHGEQIGCARAGEGVELCGHRRLVAHDRDVGRSGQHPQVQAYGGS